MKPFAKIVLMLTDFVALAVGAGVLVTNTLDSREDEAGIGAFMIVFGLLVHYWRKNYFQSNVKSNTDSNNQNEDKGGKTLITGIVLLVAFTFWGHNFIKTKGTSYAIDRVDNKVDNLENKVDDLESNYRYR